MNPNPEPPKGEEHNPDGLTPEQVGEGWRLLTRAEVQENIESWRKWVRTTSYVETWKNYWAPGWATENPEKHTYRRRIQPPAPIGHIKRNNGIRGPGFAEWDEPVYASAPEQTAEQRERHFYNLAIERDRLAEELKQARSYHHRECREFLGSGPMQLLDCFGRGLRRCKV